MKLLRKIFLSMIVIGFLTSLAFADGKINAFGLDDSLRYDIYFAGRDSEVSVIRNVVIQDVREIGGKNFFVIRPQGFKLEEALGFVSVDSVLSILPQGDFSVRRTTSMKVD